MTDEQIQFMGGQLARARGEVATRDLMRESLTTLRDDAALSKARAWLAGWEAGTGKVN
jgi:hypothetical protein